MASSRNNDNGLLIDFLQGRDAPCPHCGYNLRDLTGDVCPECQETLRLVVGLRHVRIGLFLAAVTPGLFSGIAAVLLIMVIGAASLAGGGPFPPVVELLTVIGLISGAVGLRLIIRRHRFLELEPRAQRKWALIIWAIHGLPFLGLLILVILTT